jgi:hypothetical protein
MQNSVFVNVERPESGVAWHCLWALVAAGAWLGHRLEPDPQRW